MCVCVCVFVCLCVCVCACVCVYLISVSLNLKALLSLCSAWRNLTKEKNEKRCECVSECMGVFE